MYEKSKLLVITLTSQVSGRKDNEIKIQISSSFKFLQIKEIHHNSFWYRDVVLLDMDTLFLQVAKHIET